MGIMVESIELLILTAKKIIEAILTVSRIMTRILIGDKGDLFLFTGFLSYSLSGGKSVYQKQINLQSYTENLIINSPCENCRGRSVFS
jgi:hypothetical protein